MVYLRKHLGIVCLSEVRLGAKDEKKMKNQNTKKSSFDEIFPGV